MGANGRPGSILPGLCRRHRRCPAVRIQGERAYGPGVMDDKGGIATALVAIKLLQQMKFTDFKQITLFVNTDEETSSKGSAKLIATLA